MHLNTSCLHLFILVPFAYSRSWSHGIGSRRANGATPKIFVCYISICGKLVANISLYHSKKFYKFLGSLNNCLTTLNLVNY
jgi:hypothetical protein